MFKKIKVALLYWIMKKIGKKIDLKKLEPVPSFFNKVQNFFLAPFVDRNALNRIILGPISAKLLQSGYNVGLFHYLATSPGSTLEDITTALNIKAYPAEILLNGLEALKLVQKIGKKRYYNTLPSMLLAQNFNDKFLSKLMGYVNNVLTPAMNELEASVIKNKPMGLYKIFGEKATDYYYELSKNQKLNQYFTPFMSAFSQINIKTVAESSHFSTVKQLLDVGGSVGNMAISMASYHPNIKITVYDHPSIAETAIEQFKKHNLTERLNAMSGDFLKDDFPMGYDGMLFSHVIDIFSEETNKKLLKKSFDSLSPEGKIFIFTPIVHGDHTNSYTYKIYNAYFLCLANGEGQFYPPKKIVSWVKEAGFNKIKCQHLPCNEILITGTKCRAKRIKHDSKNSSLEKRENLPFIS
jgi:2-polyprenyl-3-methyl-5-hydroxy-6-metoxy-1,4-benzoquinol methylase